MNFNNMKMASKLALGFGLAGLILVLISTLSILRFKSLGEMVNTVIHDRYAKVELVTQIQEHQNLQARYLRNAIISAKHPEQMESWLTKVDQEAAGNAAVIEKLTPLIRSPKGLELFNHLKSLRDPYAASRAELIKILRSGKIDEAGDYLLNQFQKPQIAYFHAADALVTYQEELMREDSEKMEADISNAVNLTAGLTAVALAIAVAISLVITRSVTGPMEQAVEVATSVSQGDLSTSIEVHGTDETGQLLSALKTMQAELIRLVQQVRQSSDSVANASAEIAQGNQDLSVRTGSQASALEETAATMEELSSQVKHNADSAREANQLAASASAIAARGGEVVGRVVHTMKDINDSSRKIADIISVIDGIAFQTNILALNAAVEAARAGEQGRGFAVVASEVRSLAGRSAAAAKEIKNLINASVERVEHGAALVDDAGTTMTEVVSSIRRVSDLVGEISSASDEQAAGAAQIGAAVAEMDQATQQNAALVEEMAASASSLKSQANDLVEVVAVFKLDSQSGSRTSASPRASAGARPAARPSESAAYRPSEAPAERLSARPSSPKLKAPAPKTASLPKPASIAQSDNAGDNKDWESF
jgi:methyl-accepting chemotaxis protein